MADEEVLERAIESPKSRSKTSETARKLENKNLAVLKVGEIHQVSFVEIHRPSKFGHFLGRVIVVGWQSMSMHEFDSLNTSNTQFNFSVVKKREKIMPYRSRLLSLQILFGLSVVF